MIGRRHEVNSDDAKGLSTRRGGRLLREGHEAEAPGPALAHHHHRVGERAVPREVPREHLRGGLPRDAADEELQRLRLAHRHEEKPLFVVAAVRSRAR